MWKILRRRPDWDWLDSLCPAQAGYIERFLYQRQSKKRGTQTGNKRYEIFGAAQCTRCMRLARSILGTIIFLLCLNTVQSLAMLVSR